MALVIRDGNNAAQNLPNAGIDAVYYATEPGTITTTATSATDVYQFVGAAGTVSRVRKIELWGGAVVTATTFAGTSTLVRILRRSTAGTTGTWTAIAGPSAYQSTTGCGANTFAAAAPASTLNVAGTTAFTVGTPKGILRQGYLNSPETPANSVVGNSNTPLVMLFGCLGNAPLSFTGTADYIVVNLNAVTPIAPLFANFEWEEATV